MRVIDKFYSKRFVAESEKEVYKKMMKFIFKMFIREKINNKQVDNMSFKLYEENGKFIIDLDLNASIEFEEVRESHCNACRCLMELPYLNIDATEKCNKCQIDAVVGKVKKRLTIRGSYFRERIDYLLEKIRNR